MSGPTLEELFALFPEAGDRPAYEVVPAEAVPQPYHGLLVHEHHMTVTVEAYHGGPVDVRVLERRSDGDHYARKILLAHRATGMVVQFGIVRIDLTKVAPEVAQRIRDEGTPIGRVLIEHDVLRRIEPTGYLRFKAGPWFDDKGPCYGRLALIHCDGAPAVELLEVVCR
jgi:hypothetical protein